MTEAKASPSPSRRKTLSLIALGYAAAWTRPALASRDRRLLAAARLGDAIMAENGLPDRLTPQVAAARGGLDGATDIDEQLRQVRRQARDDFLADRTVSAGGWLLAESEAAFAVACALTA